MTKNNICEDCHLKGICKYTDNVDGFINDVNEAKQKQFGTTNSIVYIDVKCDYKTKKDSIARRKDSI